MRAEQLTDPVAYHGEGPVWSARWGGLRWVDAFAGDVLSLADSGAIVRHHVGRLAAALRPRRRGGAVIAVEDGFALEDADGTVEHLESLWSQYDRRMNDGGCDPQGRFYCGSTTNGARPGACALYRFDVDRSVRVVLEGVTISNGLEWSPDGARAYYVDSASQRVDVFDYSPDGGLSGRRRFVSIPASAGIPDGLTVDAEGAVWVALYGGGIVRRYTGDGVLDGVIEVPARKVTACTFGGARLQELFITTSRENLAPEDDPLAGSVFRAPVGLTGQPAREFAG